MSEGIEWMVLLSYAAWTLSSVCSTVTRSCAQPTLLAILMPTWPLFAPRPVKHDYHTFFRECNVENPILHSVNHGIPRRLSDSLWNPKALKIIATFRANQIVGELNPDDDRHRKLWQRAIVFLIGQINQLRPDSQHDVQIIIVRINPQLPGDWKIVFSKRTSDCLALVDHAVLGE